MKSCVDSILSLAAANLAAAARSGVNYSRQRLVVHHVTLHREGTAVVLEDKLVSYVWGDSKIRLRQPTASSTRGPQGVVDLMDTPRTDDNC